MPPPKIYPVHRTIRTTREQARAVEAYAHLRGIKATDAWRSLVDEALESNGIVYLPAVSKRGSMG